MQTLGAPHICYPPIMKAVSKETGQRGQGISPRDPHLQRSHLEALQTCPPECVWLYNVGGLITSATVNPRLLSSPNLGLVPKATSPCKATRQWPRVSSSEPRNPERRSFHRKFQGISELGARCSFNSGNYKGFRSLESGTRVSNPTVEQRFSWCPCY